ncbi:unnamed protein product [Scytosiphon promiscuus]
MAESPAPSEPITPAPSAELTTSTSLLSPFSDEGFSWFKLVFTIIYMSFGFFCLVLFFRARSIFEIRARSSCLVTTLGVLLLLNLGLSVDLHCIVLFDTPSDYFTNNLLVFFVTFSIASCYVGRVIRLSAGFSPKLRRYFPTLMSEKILILASLMTGVISLAIPIYYKFTIPDAEYRTNQQNVKWLCTLVLQILQFCLLPIVWYIDDLFHISREIMVIIVLGLIQSVCVKLYLEGELGEDVRTLINPPNMQLLATSVLLGLSVIDPVRRLKFNPMARSSAVVARAVARNSAERIRHEDRRERSDGEQGEGLRDREEGGENAQSPQMWTYDKIAADQSMAAAFRSFANRALCQESVWFLEEVSRYQNGDFTITSPIGGGRVEAFEAITKRFIADGAPDEVSLSYEDKRNILRVYDGGGEDSENTPEELSDVFDEAYAEVRTMIECNILHKFTETEEFRNAANSLPRNRQARRRSCCLPYWETSERAS